MLLVFVVVPGRSGRPSKGFHRRLTPERRPSDPKPLELQPAGSRGCWTRPGWTSVTELRSDSIISFTQKSSQPRFYPTTTSVLEVVSVAPPANESYHYYLWRLLCFCIILLCFGDYNLQVGPYIGRCWSIPSSLPPASWTACSALLPETEPGHLTGDRGHRWLRKQPSQLLTHRWAQWRSTAGNTSVTELATEFCVLNRGRDLRKQQFVPATSGPVQHWCPPALENTDRDEMS